MPSGGARPNSGPKKGTKYRRRYKLTAEEKESGVKLTSAEREAAIRRKVCLWRAAGLTVDDIAIKLGMDVEEVGQVFSREVQHGPALARAELLSRLDDANNVAADKRLLDEIQGAPPGEPPPAPKAVKLGKKAAAAAGAENAFEGTSWDDLVEPPLPFGPS